ncbi:Carbonic anhydrase [Hyella patelloides LEGE 07179]|uniref:carbonic anhydrase n=1 Tax=Hyella patelloides LEGE 07179 TaxID=945734 RepID=A0A563VT35_9CYAN|nr:carbonic anhydrase [Hyella patelloides]VEP14558.1 Carbonic anhydrase [Hyella patelloides LEGE 07179]
MNMIARRKLLKLGVVALGTGVATKARALETSSASEKETIIAFETLNGDSTPDRVLEALMAGNKRFVTNKSEARNQEYLRLQEVVEGQKPLVSILGCADSRVPIEIIFDRGFGDLFVVRDAGNIATPEEIGSLEYGTAILGSKVLMVLGHEKCGAVKAALEGKPLPGQIGSIVAAIQPAIDRNDKNDSEKFYTKTIKRNIRLQVEKLNSSPLLHDLVEQGKLKIVGAYYNLTNGEVSLVD